MPFELHWLRPLWLLLLPLVFICLYLCWRFRQPASPWQQLLPSHLQLRLLKQLQMRQQSRTPYLWLLVAMCLLVTALAGPSVQKLPQPAFALNKATVLVLDMSLSMLATDVKPNRLTQARFKALDFASQLQEGELALLTFAADAYVISPLTPDHNNIRLLLPDLTPEIMPAQGSNLQSALDLAAQLLKQAGYPKGDVIVMSDGFSASHYQQLRQSLNNYPHRVSVLAFGSSDGAPVRLASGELLKDRNGSIVMPKVPLSQLKDIANLTGGVFRQNSFDQADIQAMLSLAPLSLEAEKNAQSSKVTGDQWQDAGVYLCWLLLPLALWLGKRASVLVVLPLLLLAPDSQAVAWRDLWQTPQQQAKTAYAEKDYAKALQKFEQPLWQGNAAYRSGDYQAAEQLFRQDNSAAGRYNLGNSLMQQQKFEEALQAYQAAEKLQPDLAGLAQNTELARQLLQQQQQQNSAENAEQQNSEQQNSEQNAEQQNSAQQSKDGQKQQQNDKSESNSQQQADGQKDDGKDAEPQSPQQQQENAKAEKKPSEQQQTAQQELSEQQAQQQQKAVREAWPNATPEQSQQLDGLMRKVQDDPALLLRNKMLLEYQKRQQQRLPKGAEQEW